jgi:hypothetical protein
MKNFFRLPAICLICILFSSASQAQVSATYGPEVGFTASGMFDDYTEDLYAGLNVHAGATAHLQIGNFFAVRPSVLFQTGKMQNTDYDQEYIKLTRIAVPVALLFSKNFENDNKMYFGAGPVFKYNISGKSNVNDDLNEQDIKFGSSTDDELKRTDVGLHFRGGFDFGTGLSMGLFLNYGVTNLNPRPESGKVVGIDAIGFSFAWMFGGNKAD